MSAEPCRCRQCGSPLDALQRYCLSCGQRNGPRSAALEGLLAAVRSEREIRTERTDGPADGAAAAPARKGLSLSPRACALLVPVFLGFGALLGEAAGSRVPSTLAAAGRAQTIVVPNALAPAPAPAPPSTSGASGASRAGSEESTASEPPESPTEESPASAKPPAAPRRPAAPALAGGEPASQEAGGEGAGGGEGQTPAGKGGKLPPIRHVFVVMLADQPYAAAFGPASSARYLSQTLERRGELLTRYDAIAHEELPNELALLSGQGPTAQTAADCPAFDDLAPGHAGAQDQMLGEGCVYPASTPTLLSELSAAHRSWRAYVQGIDEPGAQARACAHPPLGQPDPTLAAAAPYATFRNPLVYLHAVIDSPACVQEDVGLARLTGDLTSPKRTPDFIYISPDRCHDGSPTPCAPGAPAGMGPADAFLRQVVPEILASRAFKRDGLLAITIDEAPASGELADSSSCCGQPSFPNLPAVGGGLSPRGGGTVGALLLSPFIKGGTTDQEELNHFSLLRTIEDLFGLRHLGYAALPKVGALGAAAFDASLQR